MSFVLVAGVVDDFHVVHGVWHQVVEQFEVGFGGEFERSV